jgi:hypothetical protein
MKNFLAAVLFAGTAAMSTSASATCSFSGSSVLTATSVNCSDTSDLKSWVDGPFYSAAVSSLLSTISAVYQSNGPLQSAYSLSDSYLYTDNVNANTPLVTYVFLNVQSLVGSVLYFNTNTNTNAQASIGTPFIADTDVGGLSANLAVPGPVAGAGLPSAMILTGVGCWFVSRRRAARRA